MKRRRPAPGRRQTHQGCHFPSIFTSDGSTAFSGAE
jgi:hypothetical protein